jgi:hypothetical protein
MDLGSHYKELLKQKLEFNYALDILVFLRLKRKTLTLKKLLSTVDGEKI